MTGLSPGQWLVKKPVLQVKPRGTESRSHVDEIDDGISGNGEETLTNAINI